MRMHLMKVTKIFDGNIFYVFSIFFEKSQKAKNRKIELLLKSRFGLKFKKHYFSVIEKPNKKFFITIIIHLYIF